MTVINIDCIEGARMFHDGAFDAIVCDPPYELGFMGKSWDASGIAYSVEMWREMLRVLKPGGHLLAFSGSRTYHRMTCAIEDAGFEIRDQIMWVYGSGFPKSLDVSKAIDKAAPRAGMFDAFAKHYAERRAASGLTHNAICAAGKFFAEHNHGGASTNWEKGNNVPTRAQWLVLQPLLGLSDDWLPLIDRVEAEREKVGEKRSGIADGNGPRHTIGGASSVVVDITAPATDAARQWEGWGTALKPAHEPICVARKPLVGTVAANVLAHGTGALNIDGCRVDGPGGVKWETPRGGIWQTDSAATAKLVQNEQGRWPANLIHDGSDEVITAFPNAKGQQGATAERQQGALYGAVTPGTVGIEPRDDTGSAARFFYCAKASKTDRGAANTHPTVKPTDLMRYLCRLVTPPGGMILDPFAGSGSTGKAAKLEGFQFIGFELSAEYAEIANARIDAV